MASQRQMFVQLLVDILHDNSSSGDADEFGSPRENGVSAHEADGIRRNNEMHKTIRNGIPYYIFSHDSDVDNSDNDLFEDELSIGVANRPRVPVKELPKVSDRIHILSIVQNLYREILTNPDPFSAYPYRRVGRGRLNRSNRAGMPRRYRQRNIGTRRPRIADKAGQTLTRIKRACRNALFRDLDVLYRGRKRAALKRVRAAAMKKRNASSVAQVNQQRTLQDLVFSTRNDSSTDSSEDTSGEVPIIDVTSRIIFSSCEQPRRNLDDDELSDSSPFPFTLLREQANQEMQDMAPKTNTLSTQTNGDDDSTWRPVLFGKDVTKNK